jgi:hypothetical protein
MEATPVTPSGVRDGDPAALGGLVARRGPAVLAFCREICGPTAAPRAAAEAFARFRAAVHDTGEPVNLEPEALLLGATRHAAASMADLPDSPGGLLRRREGACAHVPTLLAARAAGALGTADQERLVRHFQRCERCQRVETAFVRAERAYAAPPDDVLDPASASLLLAALQAAAPVAPEHVRVLPPEPFAAGQAPDADFRAAEGSPAPAAPRAEDEPPAFAPPSPQEPEAAEQPAVEAPPVAVEELEPAALEEPPVVEEPPLEHEPVLNGAPPVVEEPPLEHEPALNGAGEPSPAELLHDAPAPSPAEVLGHDVLAPEDEDVDDDFAEADDEVPEGVDDDGDEAGEAVPEDLEDDDWDDDPDGTIEWDVIPEVGPRSIAPPGEPGPAAPTPVVANGEGIVVLEGGRLRRSRAAGAARVLLPVAVVAGGVAASLAVAGVFGGNEPTPPAERERAAAPRIDRPVTTPLPVTVVTVPTVAATTTVPGTAGVPAADTPIPGTTAPTATTPAGSSTATGTTPSSTTTTATP